MSVAPSMPVFLDAYLADTTHLTTEEHGAYLLLLMAMWRRDGSVPNDDGDLARIVGMTLDQWLLTKKRLASLLIIKRRFISQKRLQKEWNYAKEKRDKNAVNGSKGGRPSNINNRLAKANGSVSDNPNESPHTQSHTQEKASAFSGRASAQKDRRGWVSPKNHTDVAKTIIQEIDDNERLRIETGNGIAGEAVRMLPAVRVG